MEEPTPNQTVFRHSAIARTSHWLWFVAILVLVTSGLQIFNAAPYLDASDKSNPAKRVFTAYAETPPGASQPVGKTRLFGHTFTTTGWLGYVDNGMGERGERAFPGWITLPNYQSLADGRRWHLFFAWGLVIAMAAYFISAGIRGDLREIVVRPSDFPKMLPMQLYYLKLRKDPPPHGKYNPLQKFVYTVVLFILIPLVILTGMALSPGIDSIAEPLTALFGGRQFARLWHFAGMTILIGYFFLHMALVVTQRPLQNMRSMITGWYRLGSHDGVGP